MPYKNNASKQGVIVELRGKSGTKRNTWVRRIRIRASWLCKMAGKGKTIEQKETPLKGGVSDLAGF